MFRRTSIAWKYYKKTNSRVAECSLCNKEIRYHGSTGNLMDHLKRKHPQHVSSVKVTYSLGGSTHEAKSKILSNSQDLKHTDKLLSSSIKQDNTPNSDRSKKPRRSVVWNYYQKIDCEVAICLVCDKKLRFHGSTSNLMDHLKRIHHLYIDSGKLVGSMVSSVQAGTSKSTKIEKDNAATSKNTKAAKDSSKRSVVWQYYQKIDSDVALCSFCDKIIRFHGSSGNLREHLKRKHYQLVGSLGVSGSKGTPDLVLSKSTQELKNEDNDNESILPVSAVLWKYYNRINNQLALCVNCNKKISFHGSTGNLIDHLTRNHGMSFPSMKETDSELTSTEFQLSASADLTMDQQFSLKWNNYVNQITEEFSFLRNEEDLVDVTLSCEGKKLKAHKMLLSACSAYFRDIFRENPCQHPVIVFRNVSYDDLKAIVDFMYKGEVNVRQDQLDSFLGTAELLEVKGLTDGPGKEAHYGEEDRSTAIEQEIKPYVKQLSNRNTETSISQPPVISSPLPKKRKYNTVSTQRKIIEKKQKPEIDESPTHSTEVKAEKSDYIEDLTEEDEVDLQTLANLESSQRDSKRSASEMDLNFSLNFSQDQDSGTMLTSGQIFSAEPGSSAEVVSQEAMQGDGDPSKPYACSMCPMRYRQKGNLNSHIKSHTGETQCLVCPKVLSTKQKMERHMFMVHGGGAMYRV